MASIYATVSGILATMGPCEGLEIIEIRLPRVRCPGASYPLVSTRPDKLPGGSRHRRFIIRNTCRPPCLAGRNTVRTHWQAGSREAWKQLKDRQLLLVHSHAHIPGAQHGHDLLGDTHGRSPPTMRLATVTDVNKGPTAP
ncbi:hypothetical protein B0T19DRAFT_482637 [Cercophora scortea]|uniref:Uncharacterized protein n=1 Tax=Cercophora scortea TaxID=314031 RepID=A0AAE0IWA1_9PEZI|nr:hypothetical protein B0T19DRAFT_482637 [Cercophora scortea]